MVATKTNLFSPYQHGVLNLSHRVVYAPLTRCRSPGNIPQSLAIKYYAQRATRGGLLLSEGTVVEPRGVGYPDVPGIWSAEQVEGWKPIVAAVHDAGATFFAQLWHVGRASLPAYQPGGALPVGPSAIAVSDGAQGFNPVTNQMEDYLVPQVLTQEGIDGLVGTYVTAAKNARAAGFDGVELHAANGYLIEQFLSDVSNTRTDAYGGSVPARAKLLLQVIDAVSDAIGAERVGVRLSPWNTFLDAQHSDRLAQFVYAARELGKRGLAYLHLAEGRVAGPEDSAHDTTAQTLDPFIEAYGPGGTVLVAGAYTRESGDAAVAGGGADLVAYGRLFLANPDLPERFRVGAALNPYNRDTFYRPAPGQDPAVGYTDYPFYEGAKATLVAA